MFVHLDFETRSELKLDKVGAMKYSLHPSTEVLCMAYAIGEAEPVLLTDEHFIPIDERGQVTVDDHLIHLWSLITPFHNQVRNTSIEFKAHNAFFEYCIYHNILMKRYAWPRILPHRWDCSAAQAAAYALPRNLEGCSNALGLTNIKDTEGKAVMLQLCKPRKPSKTNPDKWFTKEKYPEKYETLYKYCIKDVEVEREISNRLKPLPETERKVWLLDQLINRRGLQFDLESVKHAQYLIKEHSDRLTTRLQELTGGQVTSAKQSKILAEYLGLDDITKGTIKKFLDNSYIDDNLREVAEIRQQLSKSSTAKFTAIELAVGEDCRANDLFMYHGASTGRWTGKGVQPQNLPKGNFNEKRAEKDVENCIGLMRNQNYDFFVMFYPNVLDALSGCLRSMVVPAEGHRFIVADFASIEARVLAWLANETKLINVFKSGKCAYLQMASYLYKKDAGDMTKDNPGDILKEERQLGKQGVLGCGYQMGPERFKAACAEYNIHISDDMAKFVVQTYRSEYAEIKAYWAKMNNVAMTAVRNAGNVYSVGKVSWLNNGERLMCKLPSGRVLTYMYPKIAIASKKFRNNVIEKEAVHFMGVNSTTRKWELQSTYGGKITENITQAVARDLLAEAMLRAEEAGYRLVLHAHDEAVAEVPIGQGSLDEFVRLMEVVPGWAEGCPIAAEGFETMRYKK